MPSAPLGGDPAPADGRLPAAALASFAGGGPFGYYIHVPFCARRCGYCDFNTYVPAAGALGAEAMASYAGALTREIHLSAEVLGQAGPLRNVDTVFVGGGTPTMLPAAGLVAMLDTLRERFGLAAGAEATVEANPDSVTPGSIAELARGGFTRLSLGMQSAAPHVLATLDRTHDTGNVRRAIGAARQAGMATSIDLIYGTPGESLADWAATIRAAIELEPDHISAYALVVEEGTAMGAALARGAIGAPDDDDEADKYELADAMLTPAGYRWYEVSNWARNAAGRCRHNDGYWAGGHWWGAGPGAHSHIGGVRWWNVRHPASYAFRLADGASPAAAREILSARERFTEAVMLGVRRVEGLGLDVLDSPYAAGVPGGEPAVPGEPEGAAWPGDLAGTGADPFTAGGFREDVLARMAGHEAAEPLAEVIAGLVRHGLIDPGAAAGDEDRPPRVVLTMRGRLMADTVVRRLLGW